MQKAPIICIFRKQSHCFALQLALICLSFLITSTAKAQCPPNIDFETGTFDGWTCYTGFCSYVNGENVISLSPSGPVATQHVMFTANTGAGMDQYGGFPVNCPNGSNHSIRLGDNSAGGKAEGISYQFTIPPGRNVYNLIYHYAVVFQDPNHLEGQQPRMEIEITNVTDGQLIQCSSFTFHPYGSVLPGFFLSNTNDTGTPVWCKNWSAVSIQLNNMAGKTIQLFFKASDCTFKKHFGYAYIDVNTGCSSEFTGATYCPDDTAINIVAPYGYESYNWWNNNFTQQLGSAQTLSLIPPPPAGTTIAVQVVPYDGYGCLDTLYAKLVDTLKVTANAGPDVFSCNHAPVQIGTSPQDGLVYQWTPVTGLTDPNISNPLAAPDSNTVYIVNTRNSGGGCRTNDTVLVKASVVDTALQIIGKQAWCTTSPDSAVLHVHPADSIQWYFDDLPIRGANKPEYRVTQPGIYYAVISSQLGCELSTSRQPIVIESPIPGEQYPLLYAVINKPLGLVARPIGTTALWTPPANLDNPASFTPVFKGAEDMVYNINITSAAGCLTVDTQQVNIIKSVEIYVPNAFTPNNDGVNDYLHPIMKGIKELRYFRVYNRLGQLLYEMKSEGKGWNGAIDGTPQQTQTVVWVLEAVGLDDNIYRKKGTAILVR